jgi:MraZ protein
VDRFLSNFTNRFDAKGRISVPATFRAALATEGFEGLFVHPALEATALDCGGARLLTSIQALLDSMPPYSREREDLSTALLGTGEILRMDSQGRTMLSERMRAEIGLGDEAVFVGQGDKFQIWEPNRFAAQLEQAKARVRALRSRTSAPARMEAST